MTCNQIIKMKDEKTQEFLTSLGFLNCSTCSVYSLWRHYDMVIEIFIEPSEIITNHTQWAMFVYHYGYKFGFKKGRLEVQNKLMGDMKQYFNDTINSNQTNS